MSHCAFRWQAKMAALGLLMCLVLLSGATCMNDLMPWLNQDTGTPATQPTTGQTTPPPTINVSSPTTSLTIAPGAVVQISWRISDPSNQAQIKVFYDADKNTTNGFTTLNVINNSNMGAPLFYNWNTTGMAAGTYYVGAQINDGTNPAKTAYAVGQVIIASTNTVKQLSLGDLGTAIQGCIFEGFSFRGYLGDRMAGRFDISSIHPFPGQDTGTDPRGKPDGVSDFVLSARTADAFYVQEPDAGEAYVFFGWNPQMESRSPNWYNGHRFSVNSVGTDADVPGFILIGPDYGKTSSGLTAFQQAKDVDGDNGAELMIGVSELQKGLYEDQSYDIVNPPAYAPFGYWKLGYLDSTGYMAVLSSQTLMYNVVSNKGSVVHVDEIGQARQNHELHPRMQNPSPVPPAPPWGIYGLRWYQRIRLPLAYDFQHNDNRFGAALGTEDIDGDGSPEWLIGAPGTDDQLGNIEFIYPNGTVLWTRPPPPPAVCHSWPYTPATNFLVWPTINWDQLHGDQSLAETGQLSNPTGIGDFNGDGLNDIASSSPTGSPTLLLPEAGAAYAVFGRAPFGDHYLIEIKDPVVENALSGVMLIGTAAGDHVGQQMTALGRPNYGMAGSPKLRDFSADGLPDWVVAAPGRARQTVDSNGNPETRAGAGAIAIIWGNSRLDGRFTWDQIGTPDLPGIVITGTFQGDGFGTYMAEAGDVNGDGADDLIVASPGAENPLTGAQDAGAVYVIYGPPAGGAGVSTYQNLSGTYDITDLLNNGPIKARVYYGMAAGHKIGPVAGAGDIDNDGYEEILIADPLASPVSRSNAGEVYLIFGGTY